jgi:hypothetical protein
MHDLDGESKVDLHEQYEKSVLAPLRRRLSDVGSTATPINSLPDAKLLASTLLTVSDQLSIECKENEKNVTPAVSQKNMTTCEKDAEPDSPSQSQQIKKLKSW